MESFNISARLISLITQVQELVEEAKTTAEWPFRPLNNALQVHTETVMRQITDAFTMAGLQTDLRLYPLLEVSQTYASGYHITRTQLRAALERTLYLLTERLEQHDLKAFLAVATKEQIAERLKAARRRKGHSAQQAADACKVTLDAIKDWESRRHRPSREHTAALADYIKSAFNT